MTVATHQTAWTDEEIAILIRDYQSKTYAAIGVSIGRGAYGVESKARMLGLRKEFTKTGRRITKVPVDSAVEELASDRRNAAREALDDYTACREYEARLATADPRRPPARADLRAAERRAVDRLLDCPLAVMVHGPWVWQVNSVGELVRHKSTGRRNKSGAWIA